MSLYKVRCSNCKSILDLYIDDYGILGIIGILPPTLSESITNLFKHVRKSIDLTIKCLKEAKGEKVSTGKNNIENFNKYVFKCHKCNTYLSFTPDNK